MRVLTGIQPTGIPHLGNYLGVIKRFLTMQEKNPSYEYFFCIVNLHALTLPSNFTKLKQNTLDMLTILLALGMNPEKVTLFLQSEVSAHAEACWLLQSLSKMGELNRMIQFKEKSLTKETASASLFIYPVLQAADILLYQTDLVPVGQDQKQHLELTQTLAARFNSYYNQEVFTIPKPDISLAGAKIMALDNPRKKMSKSSKSSMGYISLLDDAKSIEMKIKRAVTDSGNEVFYDLENKPGISNLLVIYSLLVNKDISLLEKEYQGLGYGKFKKDLIEVIVSKLTPIANKFQEVKENYDLEVILKKTNKKAQEIANATLYNMKKAMGLLLF